MDAAKDLTTDFAFVSADVYKNIIHDFIKCESGAILGIKKDENIVSAYYYDHDGSKLSKFNEYIPCTISLERIILNWSECDIYFWGFLHSHPLGYEKLSHSDLLYAVDFCTINKVNYMYMLLFIPETKQLLGYKVFSNGLITKTNIIIV